MKKIVACFVTIMLVASFGSQMVFSQEEISAGNVRTDGYEKITKGAFWSVRPEAKMISEGSIPPGCKVYVLSEEYFVRFIESEHNSEDKNYIVFPKGAKVYTKDGLWYAVNCANQIEYIRPVTQVKIIKTEPAPELEPKPKTPPVVIRDTVRKTTVEENHYISSTYEDDIYYRQPMLSYWVTPIMYDNYGYMSYGQPQIVDQRTYNNYSSQTNNYICERSSTRPEHHQSKPEAPHASGPGGRGDDNNHASGPGGRSDGGDTGSHASGPSGDPNGNHNSGGPGGRSSMTRNSGRVSSIEVSSLKSASVQQGRGRTRTSETSYRPSSNSRQSYNNVSRNPSMMSNNYSRTPSYSGSLRSSNMSRSSYNGGAYVSRPSSGGGYSGGSRGSSMGRR